MAFEELSENLKEQVLILKSRVEESRFVNGLNEKFSALPKKLQTLCIVLFCVLVCFLVLIYPINQYRSSLEFESSYETRKGLTQSMITYAKNKSSQSPDPKKFALYNFKNEFTSIATNIRLLDEQFSVMPGSGKSSSLPKGAEELRFKVNGNQFNLSQIITAAYGIKNLSDSIFLDGINVKARTEEQANYFDVSYHVSNFYVKPESDLMPKAAPKKKKKKKKGR